jgi:signal transduction histidine kinase
MEENKEDDLSGLKNELYKVMILLKEAAVQSQNQKKAMADAMSDISHQLKTPMTSLTILLDNLSEAENMDTATRRSFLSEMTRQVTHMNWLVATMLKLSRLDAGVVTMKTESVPPLELIQEVLEQLELMAEWKQLSFDLQVYPDAKSQTWTDLSADRYWLREALLNLVKNAMEHSPENGRIRIRMEQNDIYLAIAIHNDGDVIPEQEQRHIFERFYRSSHAKKDSVGIGLSLAKAVIEQQHGYITVSSSEAEGTEFLVKLLYFF